MVILYRVFIVLVILYRVFIVLYPTSLHVSRCSERIGKKLVTETNRTAQISIWDLQNTELFFGIDWAFDVPSQYIYRN